MPKRKTSKKRRRRSSGLAKGRSILSRATSAATSATRAMRSRFTRKKAPKETLWPLINKTQFPVPRKRMGKNKHDLIAEHSQCKKELEELCSSGTTKEKYDCLHNNIDNVSPECAALLIKAISPDDIYDENAEDFDLTKSALSLNRRETREFKRRNRAAIQEHIDNEFNNFQIDFMTYSFFKASKLNVNNILPLNPIRGSLINYFNIRSAKKISYIPKKNSKKWFDKTLGIWT